MRNDIRETFLQVERAIDAARVSLIRWVAGLMIGWVITVIAAMFIMLRLMLP